MADSSSLSSLHSEKREEEEEKDAEQYPVLPSLTHAAHLPSHETANASLHSASLRDATSEKDEYHVGWEPGDKEDPHNWSTAYKIGVTALLGLLAFTASLGSSIISPAEATLAKEFGISEEVAVLSLSLYVLGFAFGPLFWAPISEIWGRRISLLPAMFCMGLFTIGTAVSQSAAAVFITRFFGGTFASAPVSNVGAALGDMYSPAARGTAVTFYAVVVVGGPSLGPIIGAAIVTNPHMGWRWTAWILAILAFTITGLCVFLLPELYGPVLLKWKAQKMRKQSGDDRHHHPHEHVKLDLKSIVTKQLNRPLQMLFTEPAVTAIAVYASFVYGLLYLSLEVFPIVFAQNRGWSLVVSTLPFLGLFIGVLMAVGINLANQSRYTRLVKANGGRAVPEARLPPLAVGAFLFAIGLWWFGWTADPSIPWPACACAAIFIGAGFNSIFQQCINFLVDTYLIYAASAVSANTFLRSLMAAGLPLAAKPMFNNLGVGPAMSILAAVATLAIPVPFLFMKYGKALRQRSKFAPTEEDHALHLERPSTHEHV